MTLPTLWANTLATYGARRVELGGLVCVQLVFFWLLSAVYISLPCLAPAFSERHKIQPPPRQPTANEIRHCTLVVLRNTALSLSLAWAGGLAKEAREAAHPGSSHQGFAYVRISEQCPGLLEMVRDVVCCAMLREVFFYYAHRLLHMPRLYRAIHKTHHRFTAPVALAAQYAHPVEHLVANVLPLVLPPLMLHTHVITNWVFTAVTLAETATVHSGYDFLHGAARMHDAHHERFNLNYGVLGWMDRLHGTDKMKKRE